ncbi:MAG: DUF4340 domain-containing protein [Treponema sp.]|jgi:hypothetical protein|nr:DUF4340 domain-containing protein [Treponema sp.]
MAYKKKLYILLSLVAALALIYTATFVFDPEAKNSRAASFTWIDSKTAAKTVKITIRAFADESSRDVTELVKKNEKWFVSHNGTEYPARQQRVDDFLGILTARAAWPVRSSTAASHPRLGVDQENAAWVTLSSENAALLDLLFGYEDNTGQEIYLRKYGQNEVRSGERRINTYVTGAVDSWYNLKWIPESEDGKIGVDNVQRLSVYTQGGQQVFSRKNKAWAVSGFTVEKLDQSSIDNYVRIILTTEGDDFIDYISADDPMFNDSRIVVELGNGIVKTIRLSEADDSNRRFAAVDGYVYTIAPWAVQRLFRPATDFDAR